MFSSSSYKGNIRQRDRRDKKNDCYYPIERTHKIDTVRKAEYAGGRIPVQEKVRIVVAHAEIPVKRVAYARENEVIQRRYPGIKKFLVFDLVLFPHEKVRYRQYGYDNMRKNIGWRRECAGHRGRKHPAEHHSGQCNRHRENVFDYPQRVRDTALFTGYVYSGKDRRYQRRRPYPDIGLHGKVEYRRGAAHKTAGRNLRRQRHTRYHACRYRKFQNKRKIFSHN